MPYVTSADGTRIVFERKGNGPAVILVDGALCSRAMGPMRSVADLLSPSFSVIQYDRRGRNESGDTPPYSIEREIEDLEALSREAGEIPFAFGISSGAILMVKAAVSGVRFKKMALFEPPVALLNTSNEVSSPDHVARLSEHISAGRRSAAVRYFLRSIVGVPAPVVALMRLLPIWSKLKAAAGTLPYDAEITKANSLRASEVESVGISTAVIWGEKSSPLLKEVARQLASVLPNVTTQELKGQSHNASGRALVPVLNKFFENKS